MVEIDEGLATLIRALPEEARAMIGVIFEDVATGEMEIDEAMECIEAIFNEYQDKLTQ